MRLLFQWNNHGISFVDLQFCSVSFSIGQQRRETLSDQGRTHSSFSNFSLSQLLVIGILFSPIIKNSITRSTLYSINRICDTDLNFSFRVWKKRYFGELEISQEGYIFWKIRYFLCRNNFDRGIGRAGKRKETVADPCLNARVDFDEAQSERIFLFFPWQMGFPGDFQLTNREKIEPMDRSDENSLRPNIERYGSWSWIRPTTITG